MKFICSGNNIYLRSTNCEKDVICSLIRPELSYREIVDIYPTEEMSDEVVEDLSKVGT